MKNITILISLLLLLFIISCGEKKMTSDADISEGKCIKGDCINGEGSKEYIDSSRYEGKFKDGKREGKGKLTYANGNIYEGSWKNNLRDGKGVQIWKEGDKAASVYKEGKLIDTDYSTGSK